MMNTQDDKEAEAVPLIPSASHVVEVSAGTLGALGGAATGAAMGGPIGAIAGAVIGAAMGAASGWAADKATADQSAAEAALDEEIGVSGGSIGVPGLEHPPSQIGAPSVAASGASVERGSVSDAEGPMQAPD